MKTANKAIHVIHTLTKSLENASRVVQRKAGQLRLQEQAHDDLGKQLLAGEDFHTKMAAEHEVDVRALDGAVEGYRLRLENAGTRLYEIAVECGIRFQEPDSLNSAPMEAEVRHLIDQVGARATGATDVINVAKGKLARLVHIDPESKSFPDLVDQVMAEATPLVNDPVDWKAMAKNRADTIADLKYDERLHELEVARVKKMVLTLAEIAGMKPSRTYTATLKRLVAQAEKKT